MRAYKAHTDRIRNERYFVFVYVFISIEETDTAALSSFCGVSNRSNT